MNIQQLIDYYPPNVIVSVFFLLTFSLGWAAGATTSNAYRIFIRNTGRSKRPYHRT